MRPHVRRSCRSNAAIAELLDPRRLLSSTLSGTTLTVRGTDGNDDIRLDVDPTYVNLLRVRINGRVERFLLGDYTTIDVRAARGDDRVEIGDLSAAGHPKYLKVDAGDGNDDVIGSPYADRLSGGKGNDSIRGNGGNDTLHGDDGNDTLKGDAGNDEVNGDAGSDTLSDNAGVNNALKGGDGNDALAFERDSLGHPSLGRGDGGAGNDILSAVTEKDHASFNWGVTADLKGDEGDDTLTGERLDGGRGNDRLTAIFEASPPVLGGEGNDTIVANDGGAVDAGPGDDIVHTSGFSSTVHGGDGDDTLTVLKGKLGAGTSQLYGDGGDDTLQGGAGSDSLYGGGDDDDLHGGSGSDHLFGGRGRDSLYGDGGGDELFGEEDNDSLFGGRDSDSLSGGNGNDRLYGGSDGSHHDAKRDGNDYARGEKGADWIDPKHRWVHIQSDSNDVNTRATALDTDGGWNVSEWPAPPPSWTPGGIIGDGATTLPIAAASSAIIDDRTMSVMSSKPHGWTMTWADAAFFVGFATDQVFSATLRTAAIPTVLTAEQIASVHPAVLHVSSAWKLERQPESTGGLAWYRISQASSGYGLVDAPITYLSPNSGMLVNDTTRYAAVFVGVRPNTLILCDGRTYVANDELAAATKSWRSMPIVTPAWMHGLMPGVTGEVRFGQPTGNLPTQPTGTRALWSLSGPILLDRDGPKPAF